MSAFFRHWTQVKVNQTLLKIFHCKLKTNNDQDVMSGVQKKKKKKAFPLCLWNYVYSFWTKNPDEDRAQRSSRLGQLSTMSSSPKYSYFLLACISQTASSSIIQELPVDFHFSLWSYSSLKGMELREEGWQAGMSWKLAGSFEELW